MILQQRQCLLILAMHQTTSRAQRRASCGTAHLYIVFSARFTRFSMLYNFLSRTGCGNELLYVERASNVSGRRFHVVGAKPNDALIGGTSL